MELMILDENFQPTGIVDGFSSFQWNRKYYEVGTFELHAPPEYFPLFRLGTYLYRTDTLETAILETVSFSIGDKGEKEVFGKGRFLEQLLADRVIDKVQELEGTGEETLRQLVKHFAISPTKAERKIPRLQLGEVSGVGEKISFQVTGDNLLEKLWEIAVSQELSFSVEYHYKEDTLFFTVWQGKDRTQEQKVHSWAVFSPGYENILSVSFTDSKEEWKNFAYVAGEGEGSQRIVVEVDQTQGQARREVYIDARDLQRTREDSSQIPLAQYEEMLRQRGLERLAEYKRNLLLEGDIDIHANLIYRKDFDLGDLCTYVDHDLGIEAVQRITEISEVYENNSVQVTASFGDQGLGLMQKIKREVKEK